MDVSHYFPNNAILRDKPVKMNALAAKTILKIQAEETVKNLSALDKTKKFSNVFFGDDYTTESIDSAVAGEVFMLIAVCEAILDSGLLGESAVEKAYRDVTKGNDDCNEDRDGKMNEALDSLDGKEFNSVDELCKALRDAFGDF